MKTTHQLENIRELNGLLQQERCEGDKSPYVGGGTMTYDISKGTASYYVRTKDGEEYIWNGTIDDALKEFAPNNITVKLT